MRDLTPFAHILARIATPEHHSAAESQNTDPQCANTITKPTEEAPEACSSPRRHCSDSLTVQTTDSESHPRSSLDTPLSSAPQTPSISSTEELVDLTNRYHLPPSLLIAQPNRDPRHNFPRGVKRRARDSFSEGLAPNATTATREIDSPALDEGDRRSRKKQKKSLVDTEIWVAHRLGRFERMFAGDFRMLSEMSDTSFLQHVSETSDTDPALIQAIECHLIDTVPRQTIDLRCLGGVLTKEWTTVLRGYIQATSKYYTRLHKKLVRFEVILVPVLKGSKDAPILL